MNTEKIFNQIVKWMYGKVKTSRSKCFVLGVSGGIDSAVCAFLASVAIGNDNVHAILMPCHHFDEEHKKVDEHFDNALDVANMLAINYSTIWINEIYDAIYNTGLLWKHKTKENTMSRIRMTLLRASANENNALLIGSGNASETMVGYFTKGGDNEADIFPILELTKGQVYELADYINRVHVLINPRSNNSPIISEKVIQKAPSAGLTPGQTDEEDLGITYEDLDKLVLQNKFGIPAHDVSDEAVKRFNELYQNSAHKRDGIQYPKLSGTDLVPDFGKNRIEVIF